ncbi:MAG TPA: hypothetical protein ENN09_05105 [Planctomycetes bacterium]|nr:hypothetical protein [Planctomycetota bacterium]
MRENDGESRRRPCLNFYIDRCTGPCAGMISRSDYRENVRRLSMFVSGSRTSVLDELDKKMRELSEALRYEDAAAMRDQLNALRSLDQRGSLDDTSHPVVAPIDLTEGLDDLQQALALPSRPRLIDGMDASNLGASEAVGAVVTFADGKPQRGGYRRFRIKTVEGQDDYAAVSEIAERRYGRLLSENAALPDVVLVDGGIGHLRAVRSVLDALGILEKTALLSLAKENETVYGAAAMLPLELPPRSAGKRLLMYVRDEAHRFAQHYHHILRRKFILE